MKVKRLPAASLLGVILILSQAACDSGSQAPAATTGVPTPTVQAAVATVAPSATAVTAAATPDQSSGAPTATQPAAAQATPTVPAAAAVTAVATPEQPAPPETSPAGDIPDTQAFVKYTSAQGGYTFEAPEGWSRTEVGPNVTFVSKLDGVKVVVTDTTSAPTVASATANEVAALQKAGRAVKVASVTAVTLPGGNAILVDYASNSEPDAVTGKQVRLENNAYLFYKNGRVVTLTLWAPTGADNVDQWKRMSQSFRWP